MSTTKTRFEKVATVVVPVSDQDRAIEFYVEKLGLEKRTDVPFGNGYRWVEVAPGDAVTVEGNPTASIPIIPAALAHGRLAAENILAELEGRPLGTIDFAPQGMLVSLGERDAVVEVFGLRLSGYFAWLFWNALHLWKLVGFRKQLQVALDWGMAQFFPRDSSIMRRVSRCPVCAHHTPYRERDAA